MLPPLRATGESQSLTPFESHRDPSTPAPVAGLILPTSSSVGPGGFVIHGNGPSSIGSLLAGDDDMIGECLLDIIGVFRQYLLIECQPPDAPDFTFDENGEFVDLTEANMNVETPAALGAGVVHSDAGASAKVRQDHEDGLHARAQVSDTFGALRDWVRS
jgi:meiotic recombination protein REC8